MTTLDQRRDSAISFLALVIAAALIFGGCSLGPSAAQLKALTDSGRSWCLGVTSVYGTLRVGGSGIEGGTMKCSQEGMELNDRGVSIPVTQEKETTSEKEKVTTKTVTPKKE